MFNMDDFLKLMKKTAVDAVNAQYPANMVFGKVVGVNPLKIKVDQKLILTSAQLILSRNVTDYELSVTVNHKTESASGGSGESSFASHAHNITGKKTVTVHQSLMMDEEVILMQLSGGQKYIVIDRIGKG